MTCKIGDKVAAPVVLLFPERKTARSRYGYDIGTVIATGRNKGTGKPAVKVKIPVPDSVHLKRFTDLPFLEKWCLAEDCDKV